MSFIAPPRSLFALRFTPAATLAASLVTCGALATLATTAAQAQDYPNKTITIIVPFSPGGGVDIIARLLAENLCVSLKQSVVVDNKAGGSGMVGALAVVRAAPDGYTLLLGSAGETSINAYVEATACRSRRRRTSRPSPW